LSEIPNDNYLDVLRWKNIYKIATISAITIVVLIPIQILIFMVNPPPTEVIDYFKLFKNNSFLGLLSFDLLLVVDYILMIPIFLALYIALRRISESFITLGTIIGFIAIVTYFSSNTAFNMLYLSQQYQDATTELQKSLLLASSHSMLAIFQGTSFHISYVLVSIYTLIISVILVKSEKFSKFAGYSGIAMGIIGLGIYVPIIGVALSIISLIPGVIWYILVARGLFKMSKPDKSMIQ
jgi:hypothetical protein